MENERIFVLLTDKCVKSFCSQIKCIDENCDNIGLIADIGDNFNDQIIHFIDKFDDNYTKNHVIATATKPSNIKNEYVSWIETDTVSSLTIINKGGKPNGKILELHIDATAADYNSDLTKTMDKYLTYRTDRFYTYMNAYSNNDITIRYPGATRGRIHIDDDGIIQYIMLYANSSFTKLGCYNPDGLFAELRPFLGMKVMVNSYGDLIKYFK